MKYNILIVQQNNGGGEQIAVERLINAYKKEFPGNSIIYQVVKPFRESLSRFSFPGVILRYFLWARIKIDEALSYQQYGFFITSDYLLALAFYSLGFKEIKLVFLFHGLKSISFKSISDINYRQIIIKLLEIFSWILANKIITPSIEAKDFILKKTGLFVSDAKVSIVNNIVPDIFFIKRPKLKKNRSFVILYSGRLTKYKGLENLIRSIDKIRNKIPEVELIVAYPSKGVDSGIFKYLSKITKNISNNEFIKFIPDSSVNRLVKLYIMSDVMVLPSEIEMAPLSVVEAMATGTIVIGTNVGNIGSLLKQVDTNLILSNNSSEEIIRKIVMVYKYDSLKRKEMSKLAIKLARKFSSKEASLKLNEVLSN